jgi:hypothetical protein
MYTWNFHPDLIRSALHQGVHGFLSKTLVPRDLVAALEAVLTGETVVSDPPPRPRSANGLNWPGRGEGLTDRESEILALITLVLERFADLGERLGMAIRVTMSGHETGQPASAGQPSGRPDSQEPFRRLWRRPRACLIERGLGFATTKVIT